MTYTFCIAVYSNSTYTYLNTSIVGFMGANSSLYSCLLILFSIPLSILLSFNTIILYLYLYYCLFILFSYAYSNSTYTYLNTSSFVGFISNSSYESYDSVFQCDESSDSRGCR
jgi:hypothetical protein